MNWNNLYSQKLAWNQAYIRPSCTYTGHPFMWIEFLQDDPHDLEIHLFLLKLVNHHPNGSALILRVLFYPRTTPQVLEYVEILPSIDIPWVQQIQHLLQIPAFLSSPILAFISACSSPSFLSHPQGQGLWSLLPYILSSLFWTYDISP